MELFAQIEQKIIELKEMDLTNSIALLGLIELLCEKGIISHSELSKYATAIKSQLLTEDAVGN